MSTKSRTLFAALALLGLVACQKLYVPDTPDSVSVSTKAGDPKSSEAGTQGVTIFATSDWTASTDADWVEVYPQQGSRGISEVCLSYGENSGSESRTAVIVFSTAANSETFTLVQKAR